MERTMHRLIIHITDNDKFDKLVELDGLQPYAEALHNAIGDTTNRTAAGITACCFSIKMITHWILKQSIGFAVPYKSCSETG